MANPAGLDFAAVEGFLDRHPELVEKWLKRRTALLSKAAPTGALDLSDGGAERQPSSRHNGLSPRSSPSSTVPPGLEPAAGELQRRASQKELRKSFARSKAIHVNLTYDEHLHARAQEPLSSARRRALLRKASSLPPTTAHLLSALLESRVNLPQYPPTALDYKRHLKQHNERQFFLELVKDISNELDLSALSYKILIFVCLIADAERGSLFLVEGGGKKSLVSKVFDVHGGTPVLPCYSTENYNEMQLLWGKGIIGYVAERGETVNIPDAYQDHRFNDKIDKLTGYKTKSLLCMPIGNSEGEIIGVAQVINKTPGGIPFTDDDEKMFEFKDEKKVVISDGSGATHYGLPVESCLLDKEKRVYWEWEGVA
ncbi:dual 3',5'-cyclic-AMP and -GMP phosphodiesterase 11A-like [Candoia aspera]|uniref:dual 3',5'-cyclic-AMP and -GMP phosphodiesterase 11A-like n=1 Tax=Candoia aspera TaxID=51853 RepID=UPI002FD7EE0C